MTWLLALLKHISIKNVLLVVAGLLLVGVGGYLSSLHWKTKYAELQTTFEKHKADDSSTLAKKWEEVSKLQTIYEQLNKEVTDELNVKLDKLAEYVRTAGTPRVPVCRSAKPSASHSDSLPSPASGTDEAGSGQVPGAVREDPSGSRDSVIDLGPEIFALLDEADRSAAQCNSLSDRVTRTVPVL